MEVRQDIYELRLLLLEDFLQRVQGSEGVTLVRGKVAKIEEDPGSQALTLHAEDTAAGEKVKESFEMVVLATGMVPTSVESKIPAELAYDNYGFVADDAAGVYAAGCSRRPADVSTSVQDGTRAALKAIQSIVRGGANG